MTTPTGSGQQPEYPRPDDQSSQNAGSSSYGQPAGSGQPWDAKPSPDHTQQFPAQGYGQQGPGQQAYGQPQGYGQQGYQNAPAGYDQGAPAKANGLGIAALVLGILSIPAALFSFPGMILGLLAIIFGVIGLRRVKARRADNRGMAIAGLVTGIVGFVLGTILLIVAIAFVSTAQDCINDFNSTGDQAQYQQCIEDSVG